MQDPVKEQNKKEERRKGKKRIQKREYKGKEYNREVKNKKLKYNTKRQRKNKKNGSSHSCFVLRKDDCIGHPPES